MYPKSYTISQMHESNINQDKLRTQFSSVLNRLNKSLDILSTDLIIVHCEINERHGVGILIKRIFSDGQGISTVRSKNLYDGQQDFGDYELHIPCEGLSYPEILLKVQSEFGQRKPRRILSIPYYLEDCLLTLAFKKLFNINLCTFLMDDQNIYANNIPDQIMKEVLELSDLRLGISQPICEAYKNKYHLSFNLLLPVVQDELIKRTESKPLEKLIQSTHGIMIGNIWDQQWLDKLQFIIKKSNIKVDWYGNPQRDWLIFKEEELEQNGIFFKGYTDNEQTFIEYLQAAPFAIVPVGSTENDRKEITLLSLPSRIPFMIATANIPIIVVGRKDGAAAKFVEEHQLGLVCDYDPNQLKQAVKYICQAEVQQKIRKQAVKLAKNLSADGVADWIWQSLEQGKPISLKFGESSRSLQNASVIITLDEVTQKHGTGALVKRIFADTPDIFSIRSNNHYDGDHNFGQISTRLSHKEMSRVQSFGAIIDKFQNTTVKRVFCVPYNSSELISSIAIKEIFNVPLGAYIMDDQNICDKQIPDELMHEFLSKCSIRFATHPELRDAYESKYKLKFWILPAIVPNELIESNIQNHNSNLLNSRNGTLIGSIWSKQWFDLLCNTFSEAGVKIDWYGNHSYYWLSESIDEIQQRGINPKGLLAEKELAQRLKQYTYIVVPTGTLDEKDDRHHLSQLSLPGRIIFAMATSNTPIIILGSEKTSAASFVKRFGIGVVCDYNSESFNQAVDYVIQPEIQKQMRQNAFNVACKFSDKDIGQWVWQSLELGQAYDSRFEELFK